MKTKPLVFEDVDKVICPHCKEEIFQLSVDFKGFGVINIPDESVEDIMVESVTDYFCPKCGGGIEYD